MDVCIIGGGMMGLATAHYLSQYDVNITIMEREDEVGGLCRSAEIAPGFRWDRYYHVILSTDRALLDFLDDLDLSPEVRFTATKTGFFSDNSLHSMSDIKEFLTFKPLSLFNKLRLGAGIFISSRLIDGRRLDKTVAKTWLIQVFGRRNYEKMWAPLLRSKLGSASSRVSGTFIWAIIKRYYGTRQEGDKKEVLGCVRQGYHSILEAVQKRLKEENVLVKTGCGVRGLTFLPDGRVAVRDDRGTTTTYDHVISTLANPQIERLLPESASGLVHQLRQVEYLSLVCVVLTLKKPLSPFYVTNITDAGFPFTGIIEASNVIPPSVLGKRGVLYLPRWMPADDPFLELPGEEILAQFYKGLQQVFPGFGKDDVVSARVQREHDVQSIQTVDYSRKMAPMKTSIDGFTIVNSTMIQNSTLNNNEVIRLARRAADMVGHQAA